MSKRPGIWGKTHALFLIVTTSSQVIGMLAPYRLPSRERRHIGNELHPGVPGRGIPGLVWLPVSAEVQLPGKRSWGKYVPQAAAGQTASRAVRATVAAREAHAVSAGASLWDDWPVSVRLVWSWESLTNPPRSCVSIGWTVSGKRRAQRPDRATPVTALDEHWQQSASPSRWASPSSHGRNVYGMQERRPRRLAVRRRRSD